jgi:hypothetical protein
MQSMATPPVAARTLIFFTAVDHHNIRSAQRLGHTRVTHQQHGEFLDDRAAIFASERDSGGRGCADGARCLRESCVRENTHCTHTHTHTHTGKGNQPYSRPASNRMAAGPRISICAANATDESVMQTAAATSRAILPRVAAPSHPSGFCLCCLNCFARFQLPFCSTR